MLADAVIQPDLSSATSGRASVLMVTHVVPYPPAAGNETRIYKMLRWLRREGFLVHLVLRPLDDWEVPNDCVVALNCLVDSLSIFDSRSVAIAQSTKLRTRIQSLDSFDEFVRQIEDGFCPSWFVDEVSTIMDRLGPDVVIAQYVFMSRILTLSGCAKALKVIDTHDLFSRKKEAVDQYRIRNFGLNLSEAQESSLLRRADLVLAIQQDEEKALREIAPDCDVVVTGVDMGLHPTSPKEQVPGRVLIVASANELNVRGTQDFLDYTWPLVREQVPHARLRVIGKICQQVQSDDPSVDLAGFVESLDDEYREAEVVVNPCRVGTGLKIKTVEALAWGRAHVAWPAAADGLRGLGEVPVCIERDIVAFADAVAALILDGQRRRALEIAAHQFVAEHFSMERVYGPLEGRIAAHRQKRGA